MRRNRKKEREDWLIQGKSISKESKEDKENQQPNKEGRGREER